jgi:RNA ligase (TIGR02306 family)
MAFFGVTLEEIEKVWAHPQADRLSLAKAKGLAFQFVTGKDQFKPGDKVLYFPIDAQLPPPLIEKLGLVGKLSGENKNIFKTLRLRGEISQGYVTSPVGILSEEYWNKTPKEITEFLEVIKFEKEPVELKDVTLISLPSGLSDYDIEGADRNQEIIDLLMDQEVVVFEKMEGENNSTARDNDGNVYVNSRNRSLIEKEGFKNRYWELSRSMGFPNLLSNLSIEGGLALYYEICGPGIHGNIYGLKKDSCYIFDFKQNGNWLSYNDFIELMKSMNLMSSVAPIIFKGKLKDFLLGKTVQQASTGQSLTNPKALREGIVIKPINEQHHSKLGRLIIKQRSPDYLDKNKGN